MDRIATTIASKRLGKSLSVIAYGKPGAYPVIAFPTQDQSADEWERNGLLDTLAPYIEDAQIQVFAVDSNDLESWSAEGDYAARMERQERYFEFVCTELLAHVRSTNKTQLRPLACGCSLGATQAAIVALRRPDLFQGCIALSGLYHTSYFFGDWGDDVSYANDVNAFLPNMPLDHPYVALYRQRTFAFSVGQAADEQFGVGDLHFLQGQFERLGVPGWFDFWGPECGHDWFWWKQQMEKFAPEFVREVREVAAAEPELAKPATKPARAKKGAPDKKASTGAEKVFGSEKVIEPEAAPQATVAVREAARKGAVATSPAKKTEAPKAAPSQAAPSHKPSAKPQTAPAAAKPQTAPAAAKPSAKRGAAKKASK